MPYKEEWVDPEVFMQHAGITVYHVYKNDDVNQCARTCWYTLCREGGELRDDDCRFDVRDLPGGKAVNQMNDDAMREVIRTAIDAGHFKDWPYDEPETAANAVAGPAVASNDPFIVTMQEMPDAKGNLTLGQFRAMTKDLADDVLIAPRFTDYPVEDEPGVEIDGFGLTEWEGKTMVAIGVSLAFAEEDEENEDDDCED